MCIDLHSWCTDGFNFVSRFQRYQTLGTEVFLAMSGDATCRGIRSPRDGPVVMELSQGMRKKIFRRAQ